MDGFREANNFGFGQTSQFDNFHVKKPQLRGAQTVQYAENAKAVEICRN